MPFSRLTKILFVISIFVISNTSWASESQPIQTAKFLSVADIHFDPFSGCSKAPKPCVLLKKLREAKYQDWSAVFEQYGDKKLSGFLHDTNYPLLKSSLIELQEISKKENPQFVIILGDFLAHKYHEQYIKYSGDKSRAGFQAFVKKTLQFLTYELMTVFPKIDVYPLVGNNDSYTGDYSSIPDGKFFRDTADIWSVLIKNKENRENFKREFPEAGYYHVSLPGNKNQQIIILNTVLFSGRVRNKTTNKAAEVELKWFHKQLQNAAAHHQPVLLALHIPIGIDIFATVQSKFSHIKQFWHKAYTDQFENELSLYSGNVMGILAGHIHRDLFQTLTLNQYSNIPVIITPSISPIYGNNPGFKIFTYDVQTLQLKKNETYDLSLDKVVMQ